MISQSCYIGFRKVQKLSRNDISWTAFCKLRISHSQDTLCLWWQRNQRIRPLIKFILFIPTIDSVVVNNLTLLWRRTFATRLNAAGIGMATIQQAMGHANISTTAGYCWVSDEQLANAVNVIWGRKVDSDTSKAVVGSSALQGWARSWLWKTVCHSDECLIGNQLRDPV